MLRALGPCPSQPCAAGCCFSGEHLPTCTVAPRLQARLAFLSFLSVALGTLSAAPNLPGTCKLPGPLVKRREPEGAERRSSPGSLALSHWGQGCGESSKFTWSQALIWWVEVPKG